MKINIFLKHKKSTGSDYSVATVTHLNCVGLLKYEHITNVHPFWSMFHASGTGWQAALSFVSTASVSVVHLPFLVIYHRLVSGCARLFSVF